jgi:hypothetical protein
MVPSSLGDVGSMTVALNARLLVTPTMLVDLLVAEMKC